MRLPYPYSNRKKHTLTHESAYNNSSIYTKNTTHISQKIRRSFWGYYLAVLHHFSPVIHPENTTGQTTKIVCPEG